MMGGPGCDTFDGMWWCSEHQLYMCMKHEETPRMKSCYIAGPMRGIPEYNYPAFMAAEKALEARGWYVHNPAAMDIEVDTDEDYTLFDADDQILHDTAANARRFARRDTDVLLRKLRAENGDAIVLLPGHEGSTGAAAELAVARWVSLKVFTLAEALRGQ